MARQDHLWRGGDNNIGDCRTISWGEMWQRFRAVYGPHYQEAELKRIHDRWRQLSAEVGMR